MGLRKTGMTAVAFGLAAAGSMVAGLQGEPAHAANQEPGKAFTFDFRTIDNKPMPLEQFRGKALLVVNTASFCGFTGQYGDLQDVWERYRDDGLVVIGVPSNDFGEQEPGTAEEIKTFCEVNFDIDFPLARKVAVKGADAHPFYAWARETLGAAKAPRWNFHKYIIARDGTLVDGFGSTVRPTSRRIRGAIKDALAAPVS